VITEFPEKAAPHFWKQFWWQTKPVNKSQLRGNQFLQSQKVQTTLKSAIGWRSYGYFPSPETLDDLENKQ